MNVRKIPLVNEQYYHIFSRSIAKYQVFNDAEDFERILGLMNIYRYTEFGYKYSRFKELEFTSQNAILKRLEAENDVLVEIVAYCVMPTHFHMVLRQLEDDGISKFLSKVLNSYTKHFNLKHRRAGPLWEGHFKNVLVASDEQLLHLTRYVHLNASSAGLVEDPLDWQYSSLSEYYGGVYNGICRFKEVIDMPPKKYKKFVLDQKSYQRDLAKMKSILIDNYAG